MIVRGKFMHVIRDVKRCQYMATSLSNKWLLRDKEIYYESTLGKWQLFMLPAHPGGRAGGNGSMNYVTIQSEML